MTITPRIRGATRGVCLAALLGVGLVLIAIAYFPFRWDPPHVVSNDVTRIANGSLQFGEMNRARTTGTPDWLADARASGIVEIELEMNPEASQENSPASIMMLARDFWHTDFAIGQDNTELLVWLRRPGSDVNGAPPLSVADALVPEQWNHVDVTLLGDVVRIDVNGTRRLTEQLGTDALGRWGAGQVALGGEVHGGVPWQGRIRQAEIRTAGHVVDYTRPGVLSIPARYLYLPDRVAPFRPLGRRASVTLVLHALSFIPVGLLVVGARRPAIRPVPATLLAAGFAVVLAAGKFLFDGRHADATDLVAQTAGALLGAWLAWQWAHRSPRDVPSTALGRASTRDVEVSRSPRGRQHHGQV